MTDEVQHENVQPDDAQHGGGQHGVGQHVGQHGVGQRDAAPAAELTILLYASDRTVRENVRFTLGRQVAADLPPVRVLEVATQPAVITAMDRGGIDLAILDGEAVPGGMGLCRQLKDEVFPCPPIMVLTARRDDAWLATWSRADGVVPHPVDPIRLPEAVAALLRTGSAAVTVGTA